MTPPSLLRQVGVPKYASDSEQTKKPDIPLTYSLTCDRVGFLHSFADANSFRNPTYIDLSYFQVSGRPKTVLVAHHLWWDLPWRNQVSGKANLRSW